MLVLLLVLVLGSVLRGAEEGTKTDHASMSSKISATSNGSGVRGGAHGTVILSDLRTEGVVVVVVPGTGGGSGWRCRRGKVGSSWGCGPRSAGTGLLILLHGPSPDARDGGGGKSESARRRPLEPEGRAWGSGERDDLAKFACVPRHLVLVSPFSCWIRKRELERGRGARVGRRGLADHERVDLYALRCGGFALLRAGAKADPGHSSSLLLLDVRGVVEMSLLEQADMHVSEGVGERVRGHGWDFGR